MKFSSFSLENLKGVHPDLVELCNLVLPLSPYDFVIVDGLRTLAEEKKYKAKGASLTLNSLHLKRKDGYSHAIDFALSVRGQTRYKPIPHFLAIGQLFQSLGQAHHIPIIWGANFKRLKDYGHIELDRRFYKI